MVLYALAAQSGAFVLFGTLCFFCECETAFPLSEGRRQGKQQVPEGSSLLAADDRDRRIPKGLQKQLYSPLSGFFGIGAGMWVLQNKAD